MLNVGYNNRWVRLLKDLLFVGLAVWLICTRRPLAIIVAVLAGYWYGRDAWFQIKALWQEKTYEAPAPQEEKRNEKITLTDPSSIKEADFNKE